MNLFIFSFSMKKFVYKLTAFSLIVLSMLCFIAYRFNSGLYDPFYKRLTVPQASSMILGTSRAAQGIIPSILNNELNKKGYDIEFMNFAFTIAHSPFGPSYLNLIKRNLNDDTGKGNFIIAVDPWAISFLSKNEKDINSFREATLFTSNINLIGVNPNFEYVFKYYDGPLYKLLMPGNKQAKLHSDGWLEIDLKRDSLKYNESLSRKLADYTKYSEVGRLSKVRVHSLEKTIKYLKTRGKVFLVRMPVAPEVADLEHAYAPGFDSIMVEISGKFDVPYLNYIAFSDQYQTNDGNHLQKESGKLFTKRLAEDILQ